LDAPRFSSASTLTERRYKRLIRTCSGVSMTVGISPSSAGGYSFSSQGLFIDESTQATIRSREFRRDLFFHPELAS
jgi:hypothetical protein